MLQTQTKELLGSEITLTLPESFSSLFFPCFSEIQRIQDTYSRFDSQSALSQLNKNLNTWQDIDEEFATLIDQALTFNKLTEGAFDITLKSTLDSLGYDAKYSFTEKEVKTPLREKLLSKIRSSIELKDNRALLRKEIDFGGLGKGYALDQVRQILDKEQVSHYSINAGGDIYSKRGPEEKPWTTLLEHPDDNSKAIGHIELDRQAIASSAANRRKWEDKHHLINAKTGMPENSVKGIFVVASHGIEADVYATALFTAGFEKGIELLKKLPVEGLLISAENVLFVSQDFPATFYN